MKRRDFVALGATALALPLAVRAQKAPLVGLLWNDSVKPSPYAATLLGALRERGYVVGRNLRLEDSVALEGYAPMAESAAALVRAKVDVIVTYGASATLAAAKATKEIPIVAIVGADPVAIGLAVSLARPGGNVSGVTTLASGLVGKRIELLKELVPDLSRVGVLYAPGTAIRESLRESNAAASALKLQAQTAEVRAPGEIEDAIAGLAKAQVGAIYVSSSTLLAAHGSRVVAAIAKHRLPAAYAVERYVDAGGLMVYAPSMSKAFVRLATYVDRVLKGARPAEMPIEQTSEVELVINLKTARQLGIKIPQSILQRADRAIE
jgi:ABC-type uncharacterized transport system substrate-binding protein